MKYKLGKDLRHKGDGHTLECWFNSIPTPVIYHTTKIESISVDENGVIWHSNKRLKTAEGFEGW